MAGDSGRRDRIPVGAQLGHLEYTATAAALQLFREAVAYPAAAWPQLALQEGLAVLAGKYGAAVIAGAVSVCRADRYFRPPEPGRRVQATGWVCEHSRARGIERLTVETLAVDEIGAEIVRSEHTFQFGPSRDPERQGWRPGRAGQTATGMETLPALEKRVTEEVIEGFAAAGRLMLPEESYGAATAGSDSIHSGAILAQGMGLAAVVAPAELGLAYLHELLDRRFGRDFRQGGRLAVHYRRPIYAGDTLTAQGVAARSERDTGGRVPWQLQIWLANQRGERAIDGAAWVTVPSPLT